VTALSTYARGLEVVANAAAAQDPALLAQGQAVLGQYLRTARVLMSESTYLASDQRTAISGLKSPPKC
jgi:hypothetical protein